METKSHTTLRNTKPTNPTYSLIKNSKTEKQMKITTISFEQLYPTGTFANQRYRAEATVEEGEDMVDCFKKLRFETERAFIIMNPQVNWVSEFDNNKQPFEERFKNLSLTVPTESSQKENTEEPTDRIQAFIDLINSKYQTKESLKGYRTKVEQVGDEKVTEAYNNRIKSFQ